MDKQLKQLLIDRALQIVEDKRFSGKHRFEASYALLRLLNRRKY